MERATQVWERDRDVPRDGGKRRCGRDERKFQGSCGHQRPGKLQRHAREEEATGIHHD